MTNRERFPNWKMPKIEHSIPTEYGWTVLHPGNLKLGKYTDIAHGVLINAQKGVEIGEGTQIGPYCCILSRNTINETEGKITIGSSVRIGAYCLILPGAVIPDGSFIKAYKVVKGE